MPDRLTRDLTPWTGPYLADCRLKDYNSQKERRGVMPWVWNRRGARVFCPIPDQMDDTRASIRTTCRQIGQQNS